jgi:hypothetical protein
MLETGAIDHDFILEAGPTVAMVGVALAVDFCRLVAAIDFYNILTKGETPHGWSLFCDALAWAPI